MKSIYEQKPYDWFATKVGKKIFKKKSQDIIEVVVKDLAHACFLFDEQLESKFKYSEENEDSKKSR